MFLGLIKNQKKKKEVDFGTEQTSAGQKGDEREPSQHISVEKKVN